MDKLIYDGFIKLVSREHNGKQYDVVQSKPAAAIILISENGSHILLVKQYRPAIGKETWEIPAGMLDIDGESPCDCILRELKEETGVDIDAKSLTEVAGYYPMVGCSDHFLHLFASIIPKTFDSKSINDADVTEVKWFTPKEVSELISDGLVIDGKTILANLMALNWGSIHS